MREISENFIPVKIHIQHKPELFERFGAAWTPTQLILDAEGKERHRIEGFLPREDFLAQLEVGLARVAFEHHEFGAAERRFRAVCDQHPRAGIAPEACYWAGVSAYKATHAPEPLESTAQRLRERYPESEWTRKASVWSH